MSVIKLAHEQTHAYQIFSEQYSNLGIEGTYYLAFADISQRIQNPASGLLALDFGCGAGRSTRFLKSLGWDAIGVDINTEMLAQARQIDPTGIYYLVDVLPLPFADAHFNLIFQSFVLLECSSISQMIETLKECDRLLKNDGMAIVVTCSEEYYSHDWLSFQNDLPENHSLQSGERVRVSIRGTEIVLYDYYWTDRDYRIAFEQAGFEVIQAQRPLAQGNEPFTWVSELEHPCWVIYSLKKRTN